MALEQATSLVRVPMVNIRKMRVTMPQRTVMMCMPMRFGAIPWKFMFMLMMLVVQVVVVVIHR